MRNEICLHINALGKEITNNFQGQSENFLRVLNMNGICIYNNEPVYHITFRPTEEQNWQ